MQRIFIRNQAVLNCLWNNKLTYLLKIDNNETKICRENKQQHKQTRPEHKKKQYSTTTQNTAAQLQGFTTVGLLTDLWSVIKH